MSPTRVSDIVIHQGNGTVAGTTATVGGDKRLPYDMDRMGC